MSISSIAIQALLFRIAHIRMIKRNIVENMSVDDQKVPPTVIIEIKKAGSKTAVSVVRLPESRSDRRVCKRAFSAVAIIAIQLKIQVAHEQIIKPVVSHIRRVSAHSCFGFPILTESRSAGVTGIPKSAISIVEIQEISLRVVGDENIDPAIAIEIGQHSAKALAVGIFKASSFCYVGKGSIAIVVIQARRTA